MERRQTKHVAQMPRHVVLCSLSPAVAWVVIMALLAVAATVEYLAPHQLWFGPIYLAVMVLAAWSVHPGVALAIGTGILMTRLAAGTLPFYPTETSLAGPNLAVRAFGMLVVVGFIALARRACQREWRSARVDQLTGAWNRQAFFEIIRANRDIGGWSAIIYADLDGLKQLNDAQGHSRGDLGIQHFAHRVRAAIRKEDIFARLGGDEFVIFMRLRDEAAGTAVARRLHRALNAGSSNGADPFLSSSLGVLVLPNGSKEIDAELRAADELMYAAKKSGVGVSVATAYETDGRVGPMLGRAAFEEWEREAGVRQVDRDGAPAQHDAQVRSPPSEPPIAA